MNKKGLFNMKADAAPPTDYDMKREKGAEVESKVLSPKPIKEVHVFMKWPEEMKDRFDSMYFNNKRLRKSKKKNDLLIEWCLAGMKKLEKGSQ